jgi:hypothetical protein
MARKMVQTNALVKGAGPNCLLTPHQDVPDISGHVLGNGLRESSGIPGNVP